MRRFLLIVGSSLVLLIASLTSLTGCGGVECADGTVEQDGECVLADDLQECDDGEVLYEGECVEPGELCDGDEILHNGECVEPGELCDGDEILRNGECVDPDVLCDEDTEYDESIDACVAGFDEITCGDNTEQDGNQCVAPEPTDCGEFTEEVELDANTNECVPTDEVCGDYTAFTEVEGEHVCLPTDEVCDEGTEYSEDTGLCLPEAACQPGDVVVDGYCVAPAVELAEDAEFEADGNTNPEFGGQPVEVDVAGQGETSIFTGTIGEPEDLDGDDELNQIVDVFEFDAEEGDWFELSVRSLGIPNPAFIVTSADDDSEVFFERYSSLGTERDSMRQIAIPEAGTYSVTVLPETLLTDGEYLIGGDDWDYVGTLELIETPEADEHTFEDGNLEHAIGRLDDNFFSFDEFESGEQAELTWENTPEYADAVVTVWDENDAFVEEIRDAVFTVEIPEDGEFYAVFDWDMKFGNVGLDYEVSAETLVTFEDGDEIVETVDAEDGDVLRLQQENDGTASVDVTVTDYDGDEIVDASVSPGGLERYIGLEEGEYTVTWENDSGGDIEGFIAHTEVVEPEEIDDFDETYSGSSHAQDDEEQDFYLVEVDETARYELELARTGGTGDGRIAVYGLNHELLDTSFSVSFTFPVRTLEFEFEADTTYVIRIGNDEFFDSSFDYDFNMREIADLDDGETLSESLSAEDDDLVEVTQSSVSGEDVELVITDEDGNDVVDETLEDGETLVEFPLDEGDYTVTATNASGDLIEDIEWDVGLYSPIEEKTFDADADETVEISQDNDDGATVDTIVTDEYDELLERSSLTTEGALSLTLAESGDYTIWYYRSGEDDQEVDDIEFSVVSSQTALVETFDVEVGDVVEVDRTDGGSDVDFALTDEDGQQVVFDTLSGNDFFRYIGLKEEGAYELELVEFGDAPDPDEYTIDIDVLTPDDVDDFDATQEGQDVDESDEGNQDFYLVEFDETVTYDITINNLGHPVTTDGWARIFVYGLGDEQLKRKANYVASWDPPGTITFEFEADTTYLVRVGNDSSVSPESFLFDYELDFDEQ